MRRTEALCEIGFWMATASRPPAAADSRSGSAKLQLMTSSRPWPSRVSRIRASRSRLRLTLRSNEPTGVNMAGMRS